MNEDPEMAKYYRETYNEVKYEKEMDYNETKRVHDKYDYLYDNFSLLNKKQSNIYNL